MRVEKGIPIRGQDRVFILTGAGISAESGLATFRDANGLWHGHRPEDVATPEAWVRDPVMVWEFYSDRRRRSAEAEPNPAHVALAELEERLGERLFLCTQNVDNLHEKAGSQNVIHMHGQLFQSRCERCDRPPFTDGRTYSGIDQIPHCRCGGRIRPHVCWFGEMPYDLDLILEKLEQCTVFVTIGSSGLVQPAASFPVWAGRKTQTGRSRSYYIGVEQPANSSLFEDVLLGKAATLVPPLFGVSVRS